MPSPEKRQPMPIPDVSGLDEYHQQLVFAESNIAEGDFEGALYNLTLAEKIKQNDPRLYEMFGIVHDSMREYKKAMSYYKKAAHLYLKEGNINKTRTMLAWMNSIDMQSPEVKELEEKLKGKQDMMKNE
jgi:tetratricopeptide (TPR) repeat protein